MHDSEESKITRFVSDLRKEIKDVELWVLFFKELGSPSHQGGIIMMSSTNLLERIKITFLQQLMKIQKLMKIYLIFIK